MIAIILRPGGGGTDPIPPYDGRMLRQPTFALLLLLALAGCSDGGESMPDAAPDAASPDAPDIDSPVDAPEIDSPVDAPPVLVNHHFVVSRVEVPANAAQATALGLDIDGRPNDANNGIDNQLGSVLSSLAALSPATNIAASTIRAVDRGQILILADLAATDLTASPVASLRLDVGADPQPTPCAGPNDAVCRRHLAGTGTFTRAPGIAPGTPMPGAIVGSRFVGGPGAFVLPMAFGAAPIAMVPIASARAELAMIGGAGFASGKIGGAIRMADFNGVVVPAFHSMVDAVAAADCPLPRTPPTCNCAPNSSGSTMLSLFDTDDNCTMTVVEVENLLGQLVVPDIDLDGNGAADAVSIGLGVVGVVGSFPAP